MTFAVDGCSLLSIATETFDLTPRQAADYLSGRLSVHRHTLKKWADKGAIRAMRTPGGHWLFSREALDEFVARQTRGGEPEPVPVDELAG